MPMTRTYERIAEGLLKGQRRPTPLCYFDGESLHRGTQSLHRTKQSRNWRLFWRLKSHRAKEPK